jgi:hypothetical protein
MKILTQAGAAVQTFLSTRLDIDDTRANLKLQAMHPSYLPIDRELLRPLYTEKRMTADEIAGRLA